MDKRGLQNGIHQESKNHIDHPELWVKSPYPDVEPVLGVELHEMFFEKALMYGELTAMSCFETGNSLTYNELYTKSRSFGAGLLKLGFKKGDIAGIVLPNCLEFPVALLGCWSAGLQVFLLNPRYTEHETLRQMEIVQDVIKLVVVDKENLATIKKAKTAHASLKSIIYVGKEQVEEDVVRFTELTKTPTEGVQFSSGKGTDTTQTVAWLALTSGTTGPPKLAMLPHAHIATFAKQFTRQDILSTRFYEETGEQDRLIALMPFFHGYGVLITITLGFFQGSHSKILKRFVPSDYLKVIREHKPTVLHLVTPLLAHIVNSDEYTATDLQSVHTALAGGAAIGTGLIKRLQEKAGREIFFMEVYGMTEVLTTHCLNPSSRNTKVGSCGRCAPSVQAKVVDMETNETVGPGCRGEIWLKGALPSKGYYNNREATENLIDKDGWAHSGDVGYYDEDGYFYIVDRIKELIKVKAFQVSPSELEDLLRKHPKIVDCAVIGVPSEEHGEVPRAYIIKRESLELTEKEIHEFLNPLVSTFKQLKGGVEFTDTIPKSPSGKILRRDLREAFKKRSVA